VDILVVEGQKVSKGQLLARLESVQPEAQVAAQRAQLSSSQADVAAAEASLKASEENMLTAQASVDRANAELEKARLDFERVRQLSEENLIARQEFDRSKADFEALAAAVREVEARRSQAQAQRAQLASQLAAAQKRVALSVANLTQADDQLQRTYARAPIDGVVTNLPVRVGETVVPGIQNSAASLIMTIADMSLITAEVMVDETDIVNVMLDQLTEISIDAMPDMTFEGRVIEIGNTAILRSTGLAASQSAVSSQEAKDFKVVIALSDPPETIRPGLSCTAKITTATRDDVVSIPIQALTVRQQGDLLKTADDNDSSNAAEQLDETERKKELQGVFVIDDGMAVFREVKTGITGATDIEVLDGVSANEEIITGSYKVIRTIRNEARVKVDNETPAATDS
jgi:HlyD family secretion protein